MKQMSILIALALVASLALLPGCGESAPPEDIKVVSSNKSETPEEAPAEETPAEEAPAEEAPAEDMTKEEAPAEEEAAEEEAAEEAPAEEMAKEEAPKEDAAAQSGPVTYVLQPNEVNEIAFVGYKPTGNQQGSWGQYEGTVVITDGNIETAEIEITFDMTSLFTTANMLTDTLKNESWFNVGEHPKATFTSTSVKKSDEGYDVSGDLALRGAKVNITFPATIEIDGDTLKTQADFALLRSDWGMTDTGWGDDLVKDEVRITFNMEAQAK